MRDLLTSVWLGFFLLGYAATLFLGGDPVQGFPIDLFLPVYVLMIVGVALTLVRRKTTGPTRPADEGEGAVHGR